MAPHAETGASRTTDSSSRYHATCTESAIKAENEYAAHNYHPLPMVFSRAKGVHVWDPEGRQYLDFLSAYSAVNQGHCHPELVKALTDQASRLTLSSRAFYNDVFPKWAEKIRDVFGYEMVLPMNTGVEATETAVKIARKWAYKVKGVEKDKALVFCVTNNFHGRSVRVHLSCVSLLCCGVESPPAAIGRSKRNKRKVGGDEEDGGKSNSHTRRFFWRIVTDVFSVCKLCR